MDLRVAAKRAFSSVGLEVHKLTGDLGEDAFADVAKLCRAASRPVVADVGANKGQTIDRLRGHLQQPVVHAFEPGPTAFATLERRMSGDPDVRLNHCALGSRTGTLELIEHVESDMSSVLEIGPEGWGEVKARVPVDVRTLDEYCAEHRVGGLDLLKTDTQGYDLEVLRGAAGLLERGRVHMVLMEVNLIEMYEGMPRVDEVFAFTSDHGLRLVSFYNQVFGADHLRWADALFVNPEYDGAD
jgi:FkbM family methyltransferase